MTALVYLGALEDITILYLSAGVGVQSESESESLF